MSKNLVIVESPSKAKTLSKFLGSDYEVKSSFGHIRDLPKKGLNIDIDNDFKPIYEISSDKKKVVNELKTDAKGSEVWLASDEDREGEAIAWHLTQALNLDPKTTKRIVFHEITKPAIEQAIKNPRTVDINLVDAQQARRVLDRLVGYELSPILWKKVRGGLSAGRVQSVAVRLVVEREREIKDHVSKSTYKITAEFRVNGQDINAELDKKINNLKDVNEFFEKIITANFTVDNVTKKPAKRSPSPPFTTSTLQQEASRKLGYNVRQTMTLAQRLYESGYITYMRTDSMTLSGQALALMAEIIKKDYGEKYHHLRQYKTKNQRAQEAHEAIRPTNFHSKSLGSDAQQQKLYELIWKRALASQMSSAELEKTEVNIINDKTTERFIAKGEIQRFDGFMRVYGGSKEDVTLPEVHNGDKLTLNFAKALTSFDRPPARYSEATLVRKLEELGIGRPSTYAPTISTIQTRGYVEKTDIEGVEKEIDEITLKDGKISSLKQTIITGSDRSKLLPTHIAEVVTDFLIQNFPQIIDYDFTAKVENSFDEIADGKTEWNKMIGDFYTSFHPLITASEKISRSEVSKARELGNDPKSGEPIYARFGRYGPMLVRGDIAETDKKPEFAPIPMGTTIDTVTLEQALEMFKLPRTVGKTEDNKEIKANIGRFGPYIQIDKTFVSIKPLNPHQITEEEARELYKLKLEKDIAKNIKEFKESGIKVLNGQYGPYVTDGKKNVRIPKNKDPLELTEEEAVKILETNVKKSRNFKKKKTTKA